MNFKIRSMDTSDIDEVYAIESSAHITPWSKEIVRDCVLVGYDCRVLELDNKADKSKEIVGYIISRIHNSRYHILNFCIAKTMQSQGLGKQFLQAMLNSLIAIETIEHVILEVRTTNTVALNLPGYAVD